MDRIGRFTFERWMQGVAWHDTAWLLKRRWRWLLLTTLIGAGAGVAYLKLNPDTYVSRAQVRFIPPQVNERYVTPNVAMQAEQRIFALTQILNSRLTASRMIESYGLYPERRAFYPIADLVDRFQETLELRQTVSTSSDPNLRTIPSLSIAFHYSNPETARKVVRRIMELVYEENRRYRGDQSIGTTEFLQQQVKTVVEQMGDIEARLSLLPPAGPDRFSNLVEVEELHDAERRLTDAKHQERNIMTERELRARAVTALEGQLKAFDREPPPTKPLYGLWELQTARSRVAEARARYTRGHPDREAAEAGLQRMEQELGKTEQQETNATLRQSRDVIVSQLAKNRADFEGFDTSLRELRAEIAALGSKVERLRQRFRPAETKDLDRLILTREYAGLQEYYRDLLKKQRESQVASEMERRGQGETVELIEPPTLPGSAEQPNWIVKMALGTLLGWATGALVVMLAFLRRPLLLSADHLPLVLDVPVIAELPAGPALALPAGAGRSRSHRALRLRARLTSVSLLAVVVAVALLASSCRRESIPDLMARGARSVKAGDDRAAILSYRRVLQLDAKHAEANMQLADASARTGQVLAARDRLIRVVELMPERYEVAVRLAELSYQIYFADPGRPAPLLREIEDLAQRLMDRFPQRPDGYRLKAQALLERRRTAEAIEMLEPAAGKLELDAPLVAQLASCYYRDSRAADAERTLRSLLSKAPSYVPGYDLLYLLQMEGRRSGDARLTLESKARHNRTLANLLQLAAHDDALGGRAAVKDWLPRLAAEFSNDAESHARIGDFWLNRAEFAEARKAFLSGQAAHPKQRSLYAGRLAETHIAEKNPQEARRLIESELTAQPADPLLKAYQSALDLESATAGNRVRARAQLESILSQLPNSPFVRFHLGRAYLRDGEFLRAGEQLERCVSLDPNYAPGWVALAEANYATGHLAHADHLLKSTLRRAPSYVPALLLQAQISLSARQPAEAERSLRQLLQGDPANERALMTLAQVKLEQGQAAEAASLLARLPQNDPAVVLMQAQAQVGVGKTDAALGLLEGAVGREPANTAFRHALARLSLRAGRAPAALSHYRKLLAEKPNDLELRLGFANALGLTGDAKQAADVYRQVQASSGQDPRPWLHYAALLSDEGRAKEAQDAYKEAINRDKNNPYALNNLAYLMAKQRDDLQTALSYAQQAKRTMPDSATINDTLAYVYLLLGMARNAAAVIEETMPTLDANQRKLAHGMIQRLRRGETAPVLAEVERGALRTGRL